MIIMHREISFCSSVFLCFVAVVFLFYFLSFFFLNFISFQFISTRWLFSFFFYIFRWMKQASDVKWSYAFVQICNCTRDWILIQKSVNLTLLLAAARTFRDCFILVGMGNNAIGSDLRLLSFCWCYWCWYGWRGKGYMWMGGKGGGIKMFILWQNKSKEKWNVFRC